MSKPSMSNEEYKRRKGNLLKKAVDKENKFLEYVLFCVVSNRGYTRNDMITDLSKARLEIASVIVIYNDLYNNQVVINPFGPVSLSALDQFLTPFIKLVNRGISLRSIESSVEKYKAKGYNTSNLGDLIEQIISGKPASKSYIPQGVPYTFEEKPQSQEEMIEVDPELEKFLNENRMIEVNHVAVKLPEKINSVEPAKFNELLKDNDIINVDYDRNLIHFSDDKILQINPQTNQELVRIVQRYLDLTGKNYPFMVGLIIILDQTGKLGTVKGMIDIEEQKNEINEIKRQLEQKNQEIELQRKSAVDREQNLQMRENVFQQNVANAQNQQNAAAAEEIRRKDEQINQLMQENQNLQNAAANALQQKENEKESITLEKDETKKQLAQEKEKTIRMENEIQRKNQIENMKKQFKDKGEEIDIPMDFDINNLNEKDRKELKEINIQGWNNDIITLTSGQTINVDNLIGTRANAAVFRQYAQFFSQLEGFDIPVAFLYLKVMTKYNRVEELEMQIESILRERNMENPVLGRMEQEEAVPTQQAGEGGDDGTGTETELSRSIDRFIQQHQDDVPDVILENKYTADKNELEKLITEISVGLKANRFNFNNDQLMYIGKVANIKDIIPGYEYLKQLLEVLYDRRLIPIEVLMLAIIMIERKDLINQFLQKLAIRIVQLSSVTVNGVNVTRINPNDKRVSEIGKFLTDSGFVIDEKRINKGDRSVAIRDVFGNDYELMRNYVIQNYGIRDPADRVLLGIYLFCMDKQYGNIEKLGGFLHQHGML